VITSVRMLNRIPPHTNVGRWLRGVNRDLLTPPNCDTMPKGIINNE
jgi:hypothetical protein